MDILLSLLAAGVPLIIECILGLVCEVFVEIGVHTFKEPFQAFPKNRVTAAIGYAVLGALAGALSLLLFPQLLIGVPAARRANLIFSPILAGFAMMSIGAFRRRRGEELIRLDSFSYGALFALALALIRLMFGR